MKFIISIVLLSAVLFSCSDSKVKGIVTLNTPIYDSETGMDTLRIVPAGTVVEDGGANSSSTTGADRARIRFNGTDGYISRRFIVFNAKPGMMKENVEKPISGVHFRANGFVVYDSTDKDQVHTYYGETSNSAWIDSESVDLDTANAAVAALVDALDNNVRDDASNATLAKIAANHSTHPLVQILKVDLSEVPDNEINQIQKKYNVLLNKSQNQVFSSKETAIVWMDAYLGDILALPADEGDEYSTPRLNYFYKYVCALPSFVKLTTKSVAFTWGAPKESDPLKSYLLFRIDRSPENIKMVYDIFKPAIVEQLSGGFLQDVRPDIDALITAYDRIMKMPNHRTTMGNISKKIAGWDKEHTDENGINNAMYTLFEQVTIYAPIIDREKYDLSNDATGIWYASFWTRRFAEGNEKVVYDILKELSKVEPSERIMQTDQDVAVDGNESDNEGNETELITCTFKDYSVGDCGHILFSCGDYGDADIRELADDEKKLWRDLGVDDETQGPHGNPKYVGKTFSIRIGTTTGPACNEGQGGEGSIPRILEFKLLN